MTKEHQTYIANMLRHSSYKKDENYCISGIYWLLRAKGIDLELKTQQTVFRKDAVNHVAYMDGYFPALNIEIEIDEAYHQAQPTADKKREKDILLVMGAMKLNIKPTVIRIDCTKDRDQQILDAVEFIAAKYEAVGKPVWIDEDVVEKVKSAGKLSYSDNIIFKYKSDVFKAIGLKTHTGKDFSKKGVQRLTAPILDDGRELWFPAMSGNSCYHNSYDIINDEFITSVKLEDARKIHDWIDAKTRYKSGTMHDKHIFFKVKDQYNNIGYKYFGKYRIESYDESKETFVWKRISTEDFKIRE